MVVLRLVLPAVSDELIRELQALLRDAKDGKIVGLAYVAMHNSHEYTVDIAGETKRCPTMTRGMLHLLDDELSAIIRGK